MRHRPSNRGQIAGALFTLLTVLGGTSPARANAQGGLADQAALFLLLPVGARAVGMGTAMAAMSGSTDNVWWNPSGIASIAKRDASLHHSQSIFGRGDALSFAMASSSLGVVALSANILDYGGEIPALDNQGTQVGTILPRNVAVVATYATEIGSRVRGGVSYKLVQFRFDCRGQCPDLPTSEASTSALDVGAQWDVPSRLPVTLGAVIRNIGVRLQVKDNPQADPLPTRLQVGAVARYAIPKTVTPDAEVRFSMDVIDELPLKNPLPRFGAEFGWEKRAFVRAGYVVEGKNTESGGPSLGLGFVAGRFVIDFARVFTGLSVDAGQAPTHLSLRVTF